MMKLFLVADDSPVVRKVARRILEDLGFVVVEAESGTDAQQKCDDNMPDAILIDWDMPGVSGVELTEWLATHPGAERLKMIYCTSEVLVPEMTRAKRAGAHSFLLKPFNREILIEKLTELDLIDRWGHPETISGLSASA